MIVPKKQYSKTLGYGGSEKCRVYYRDKFKRMVAEKTVNDTFLRTKEGNLTPLKTLITNYTNDEVYSKKK